MIHVVVSYKLIEVKIFVMVSDTDGANSKMLNFYKAIIL